MHKIYIRAERGTHGRKLFSLIRRAVKTALSEENVGVPCEVSVTITDDKGIHELNRSFRDVDAPTDVLSFPMQELTAGAFVADEAELDPKTGRLPLGDIVISSERAQAQAEEYGHSVSREAAYLTVHSVLHLLGYDHVNEDSEKKSMREREEIILAKMGLTR